LTEVGTTQTSFQWVVVNQDDVFVRSEKSLERVVFFYSRSSSVGESDDATCGIDGHELFMSGQPCQGRRQPHNDLYTSQEVVNRYATRAQPP
jgi:hypothetical protein